MYNDVNSQQDATNFSFINLFKSAQHVSGDKFAHSQEPQPLLPKRATVAPVGSRGGAFYQKLYIQSKKCS
jgi:hypothetical protein